MKSAIRASLIYNPTAGGVRRDPAKVDRLARALRAEGLDVRVRATGCAGHATALAAAAAADGVDVVLVCGGDGTINEAAQSLVGGTVPLAVWPGGTANLLARELRLPRRERDLARLIASGSWRTISVGRASVPGEAWRRYFLLMAGIGMDARIVAGADLGIKRLAGKLAYVASGLGYLARLPQTPFSIDFNGGRHDSTFTVVSNAAHYGGGFTMAPGARLDDDRLEVCVFNTHSRWAYLAYALMCLAGGRHTARRGVVYQPARQIAANANPEALVQIDGDVVGHLPMRFDIVPEALRVIAPGP